MAEIKKPNLYSNILWIASQPVTKEWQKFAKSIPVASKVTTWPWITTPTKINKPLLESMKKESEAPTPITTPTPVARIWTQVSAWVSDQLTDEEISQLIDEWYTDEEIMKANDDLLKQPTQEEQGFDITPSLWDFWDYIWEVWTNIKSWLFNLWADISKLQRWDLYQDTWIKPWLLWKTTLKVWEYDVAQQKERETWLTPEIWLRKTINQWLDMLNLWADIWWEAFFSWLKTISQDQVKKDLQQWIENFANTETWKKFIEAWQKLWDKADEFAQSSPNANTLVKTVKAVLNTAWYGWWKKWVQKTVETAEKTLDKVWDAWKYTGKQIMKWWKVIIEKPKKIMTSIKESNKLKDVWKLEKEVWKVIQWETTDIKPAIETLKTVDTKWVKTYKDLLWKVDEKQKNILALQDNLLQKEWWQYWITNTKKVIETPLWKKEVNYVWNAIDDIKREIDVSQTFDDYNKPLFWKDKTLWEVISKVENNEASLEDLNDLARYYNWQFRDKIYTKTWEAKDSILATKYEANRTWIKNFVRDNLPTDELKQLDKQYWHIAETKRLLDKVNEWVNKLEQKVKERWLLERWARWVAKLVDIASMWTIRGFFTWLLPSNIWNKINNFIDIQWDLSKHLENINKLLDKKDLNIQDIKNLSSNLPKNGNINNTIRNMNNTKVNAWLKTPNKIVTPKKPNKIIKEWKIDSKKEITLDDLPSDRVGFIKNQIEILPKKIEDYRKLYKETWEAQYRSFISKAERNLEGYKQELLDLNIKTPNKIIKEWKMESKKQSPIIKTPTLSEKWWIKTVTPEYQHKFNQWADYKAVRVISNAKDSKIIRYWTIEWQWRKTWTYTKAQLDEQKSIEQQLWITRKEILDRSNEIKEMAKKVRNTEKETILDLNTKPTILKPKLSEELKPLIEEAKKYKNEKDFIKWITKQEDLLWNYLKKAQNLSNEAKDNYFFSKNTWSDISKMKYYEKSENIDKAIKKAKDLWIKVIKGIDNTYKEPLDVIYFELPEWQVSFHYPDFNQLSKVKNLVESIDDYKWSGKTNSEKIIDDYILNNTSNWYDTIEKMIKYWEKEKANVLWDKKLKERNNLKQIYKQAHKK